LPVVVQLVLVGREDFRVLRKKRFPVGDILPLASANLQERL